MGHELAGKTENGYWVAVHPAIPRLGIANFASCDSTACGAGTPF